MEWNKNKLTERLLAEGYTPEHGPDFVCPYLDAEGGFTYSLDYLNQLVYVTSCGLLLQGRHFHNGYMSYQGIDWRPENDNPVVTCPYHKKGCTQNHPLLQDLSLAQCACTPTAVPYDYSKSYDKVEDDLLEEKRQSFKNFTEQKRGRTCILQCQYSEQEKKWGQQYDPWICARENTCSFCSIFQRELTSRKGNIFYDRQVVSRCQDGSLFDGTESVRIIKGYKLLAHPVSLDICQQIIRHSMEDLKAPTLRKTVSAGHEITVEIQNVRAEYRETRDLMQDLNDVRNGIAVYHQSDLTALEKQQKQQCRQAAKEKRIERLRKKIRQIGFENLEANDRMRVSKFLQPEEIAAENNCFLMKKADQKPIQMTLYEE